jgi:hypothetical protein
MISMVSTAMLASILGGWRFWLPLAGGALLLVRLQDFFRPP